MNLRLDNANVLNTYDTTKTILYKQKRAFTNITNATALNILRWLPLVLNFFCFLK